MSLHYTLNKKTVRNLQVSQCQAEHPYFTDCQSFGISSIIAGQYPFIFD